MTKPSLSRSPTSLHEPVNNNRGNIHCSNRARTLIIRPDMPRSERELPQHSDVRYLDKFLMEALTARSEDEVAIAKCNLRDMQDQCLQHIRFLSELESFYRTSVEKLHFDHDEERYNEAISFMAGLGSSLSGVVNQLCLAGALNDTDEK